MNEEFQNFIRILNHTEILTLNGEPLTLFEVVVFVLTLGCFLVGAHFLRKWLARLFNRLRMPQNTQNRLLAISFLIVMVMGLIIAFSLAGIQANLMRVIFHYPLTELFQPPPISGTDAETVEGSEETQSPQAARNQLTLAALFYAFVIIFSVFVLSKYVQWVLRRQVLQAFQIAEHTQFILLRFFHISAIIIGILISLTTIGVGLTSLALIFGGLSIGIGFGLQNIASNLISGFILIFERPIKIGDLVEIMDVNIFGRVSAINLRSTVIVALDEKEIIVPNSQLITEPVHNLTHYNSFYRICVKVGVSYSSDVELVKRTLLETAHAHPDVISEPKPGQKQVTTPFVRFVNFGESSLDFELLAWIPDSFQRFDIVSELHFAIWHKFQTYGIQIPFPQRDVHFYSMPGPAE